MASEVSFIDLDNLDLSNSVIYRSKSKKNIETFKKLFLENPLARQARGMFSEFDETNKKLLERICSLSEISPEEIEIVNISDELLNMSEIGRKDFGCTSVGRNGIVGQNLDLYDVELAIVREGGALYVTMPPYLTLMGMNGRIAFCTNHIFSEVAFGGTPVSEIRRNILRKNSLREVKVYLEEVKKTTCVNFLVSDGYDILDFEASPEGVRALDQVFYRNNRFNVHTNHIINGDIRLDHYCSRLERAVEMSGKGKEIEEILDDPKIHVPLEGELGFGTIIKLTMDVKNGTLRYKDPEMKDYQEVIM